MEKNMVLGYPPFWESAESPVNLTHVPGFHGVPSLGFHSVPEEYQLMLQVRRLRRVRDGKMVISSYEIELDLLHLTGYHDWISLFQYEKKLVILLFQ
jgi:hypothetical protein